VFYLFFYFFIFLFIYLFIFYFFNFFIYFLDVDTYSIKISYQVFADAECRRLIKRVVHDLKKVEPSYGQCTKSAGMPYIISEDPRVALTVCHNDNLPRLGDVMDMPPQK
jgi:hypothetical protein